MLIRAWGAGALPLVLCCCVIATPARAQAPAPTPAAPAPAATAAPAPAPAPAAPAPAPTAAPAPAVAPAPEVTVAPLPATGAPPPTAPPPPPVDAPEPEPPRPVPNWSIRFGLALGAPVLSSQEELLDLEGYGGARWNVSLGVSRKLNDNVGVGGLILYGWRTTDPATSTSPLGGTAPEYEESTLAFGAQLPLSYGVGPKRSIVLYAAPWAGVGYGVASFHNQGDWKAGPAFGAGAGLFIPSAYFGLGGGAYWVPVARPGDAGGHEDFGMYYFTLFLGADVG